MDLEAALAKLRQAEGEIKRLKEKLKERERRLHLYDTRQAYRFGGTLIEVREQPWLAWKLPVAFAKLVLPSAARDRANKLAPFLGELIDRGEELSTRAVKLLAGRPPAVKNEPWPTNTPLVSVVIPCFNYGRFLGEALQSLHRQTLQDHEIIVVEGGSTDGTTPAQVQAVDHPKVRKIFQPRPTRVGDNRLAGLKAARGKYVVFLDADDMLEPTYLEKAVMALELTGVDMVYPSVQLFDRETWIWETANEFTLENLAKMNTVATVAMFRVETWKRLEIGYGTHVKSAIEDWDFWLRFAERGARGFKIHEPLMLYRVHGSSFTDASKTQQEDEIKAVLAEHRPYLGRRQIAKVTREQKKLPCVEAPLLNLSRLERPHSASLRVGLAVPWLAIGGSDHLMLQIFDDLREQDASLCVYASMDRPENMGSSAPAFQRLTDDVFDLPKELPASAHDDAIVHLLRSRRTKLLMMAGSARTYDLLPRLRAELPGLRVVDHLYNTYGHFANNRRHAREIDFHIVANAEVRDALVSAGEAPERIEVVHHGIDMGRFDPTTVPLRCLGFEDLPLAKAEKLVLYAGRFSEEKGVLRFVDIVHGLRHQEGLAFAMVGDGPEMRRVEEWLQRRGLEQRVRLTGFVEDQRPYVRRADVVVIPSEVEGLPLICLEALALGTPVVASAIGALPTVIQPGVNGFLADPKDTDSFAVAIQRALALGAQREALARTCRDSVIDQFDINHVRDRYFEIFRRVAGLERS